MLNKKEIRKRFCKSVFARDQFSCVMCGHKPIDVNQLDAHHITDRNLMPFGGYIAANGISLCTNRCKSNDCHLKAEQFHLKNTAILGYTPNDLYDKIKSSYKHAYAQSLKIQIAANKANAMIDIIDVISKLELEICFSLSEKISQDTWELTCEKLNEIEPLIIAYGKGRYVSPEDVNS